MFHAGGWTYPWTNVFAFATQVREQFIFFHVAEPMKYKDHDANRRLPTHMETLPQFCGYTLLRCTNSTGARAVPLYFTLSLWHVRLALSTILLPDLSLGPSRRS